MVRPGSAAWIPRSAGDHCRFVGRSITREVRGLPEKLDRGEPPGLDLDVHLVVDGAVDPGAFEQVRRHAGSPDSSARTSARASTPARQSAIAAVSSGRVRHPRRVADEEHRGGDAGGREDAGVVAGGGRDDRPAPRLGQPRGEGGREGDTAPDTDSGVTTSAVPSRDARSEACRSIASTNDARAADRRRPRVQPGRDAGGHGVGGVRRHVEPAERRPLPGQPRLLVGGQRGHRVGQHRVGAVLHARRARVVRQHRGTRSGTARAARSRSRPRLPPSGPRGRAPARRAARRTCDTVQQRASPAQPDSPQPRDRPPGTPRRGRAAPAPPPTRPRQLPAASPGTPARTATPPPPRTPRPRAAAPARSPATAGRRPPRAPRPRPAARRTRPRPAPSRGANR